jgi:hypothetical protein
MVVKLARKIELNLEKLGKEKLTLSKLTQAGYSPYAMYGWCASCRRWIHKSEIIYKQTEKRLVTICPNCGNFGVRLRPHQKIAKNKGWNLTNVPISAKLKEDRKN